MKPYEVFIHARVLNFARTRGGAKVIRDLAFSLSAHPFTPADLHEFDELGRENDVIIVGKYAVTLWIDHAAREVRISAVRSADGEPLTP